MRPVNVRNPEARRGLQKAPRRSDGPGVGCRGRLVFLLVDSAKARRGDSAIRVLRGYHGRATVHSFRSTASTTLNKRHFNRDWIEMQLAHADGSVRGVCFPAPVKHSHSWAWTTP